MTCAMQGRPTHNRAAENALTYCKGMINDMETDLHRDDARLPGRGNVR